MDLPLLGRVGEVGLPLLVLVIMATLVLVAIRCRARHRGAATFSINK